MQSRNRVAITERFEPNVFIVLLCTAAIGCVPWDSEEHLFQS
jgi:hypothetical protein